MFCRMSIFGALFLVHAIVSASVAWMSWWACFAYAQAMRALQQADGSVQA